MLGLEDRAASVVEFILAEPDHGADSTAFAGALAQRLIQTGIPVSRLRYALTTMHPEVLWRSVMWQAGKEGVLIDQPPARLEDPFYTNGPIAVVRRSLAPLRVRLTEGELPFALCVELRFTQLSDVRAPARVIQILDSTFDAIAGAVADNGGEVLKFIGDAVLAIFPLGADASAACRSALAAAEQAFAGLAGVNQQLGERGEGPIEIGVALHRGPVMYGNIGARDRLDFTVISSAVNEASRLESLCKPLGVRLALSAAFVAASSLEDAVDLGEHTLRGVRAPLRVFTLRG